MSTQSARSGERGYHQDYIARIRYENALPPPPGAPKLLNIPAEGLSYYTSSAFGSRLAKQQPINIETDAELGMPVDLVGMPGIFDGDESGKKTTFLTLRACYSHLDFIAIQAPLAIPPVHPKDKNLLRPLSELGKPKFSASGHSFLRRTEYISSEAKARAEANANVAKSLTKSTNQRSRKPIDVSKEDPMNILRYVVKGFDIANPDDIYKGPDNTSNIQGAIPTRAELDAWKNPQHPTKNHLQLLDSYPIKPDLDALPDSGAYMITKLVGNPTNRTDAHDVRLDTGLIFLVEKPSGEDSYEFYLPKDVEDAHDIKRQFDTTDPGRDDPSLRKSTNTKGVPSNRYNFHRTYDIQRQLITVDQPYKEVALVLYDPDIEERQITQSNGHDQSSDATAKAAYYYPVNTKTQLKPRRNKALAQLGLASQKSEEAADKPDAWNLVVRDPDEEETGRRAAHRAELDLERSF